MKNLKHIVLTAALITIFGSLFASFGQQPATSNEQYSAPVNWTEYAIGSQQLSIQLPKLPVARVGFDPCSESDVGKYHAYADGVVYEFEWHTKSRRRTEIVCFNGGRAFKTTFPARLSELKGQNWGSVESEGIVAGMPAKVLRSTSATASIVKTRWLILLKDQWLELGITHRKGTAIDEGRFTDGLKLSSSSGREIGSGADGTLGDADVDSKSDLNGKATEGLVVVGKPKPSYTEEARLAAVQGTVVLRVTFIGNGGVGSITVVKGLPSGLTEQAISVARKLSYLPATANGKPVTVTKQVEYSFGIY